MRRDDPDLAQALADFERVVNERDGELGERVLHPDYALVLLRPSPAEMPRAQWLRLLPEYVVHRWEVEDRRIDVDGDVAAVLQLVQMDATVAGEDRSGLFVISDIWRRTPDGWRVWRRHSTPFSAGRLEIAQEPTR